VLVALVIGVAFFLDVALQAGAVVALLALWWIGWELHRIANHTADCSDKFDAVQTGITSVEDGITMAGADIVDAINSQASDINQDILAVENKLPD
jgi:hypothetical protein